MSDDEQHPKDDVGTSEQQPKKTKFWKKSPKVNSGEDGAATSTNTDEYEESEIDLSYGATAVIHVTVPVSICMILVICSVNILDKYKAEKESENMSVIAPLHTKDADTTTKLLNTLGNAMIIVAVITCMTFVLYLLYKFSIVPSDLFLFILSRRMCILFPLRLFIYRCYKFIQMYMMFVTFVLILFFGMLYTKALLIRYNYPIDWFSIGFFLWNLVMLAEISIHYNGPLLLQQSMLIIVSVLMALLFIETLPDWTGWAILAVVSLYDLYAVLTPHGPLSMLVNLAQERNEEFFPALVYSSGMMWGLGVTMANTESVEELSNTEGSSRKKSGIKLGLGDFIFYSLLVGKAAVSGDWGVILACFSSIIVGLCLTLLLLVLFKRALPALPISIALGLLMYCGSYFAIQPFMDAIVEAQTTL